MTFDSWFPLSPAHPQADNAKPCIIDILFMPNLLSSNVGNVENPPPYPALTMHSVVTIGMALAPINIGEAIAIADVANITT